MLTELLNREGFAGLNPDSSASEILEAMQAAFPSMRKSIGIRGEGSQMRVELEAIDDAWRFQGPWTECADDDHRPALAAAIIAWMDA